MYDRAMQTLYALALELIEETKGILFHLDSVVGEVQKLSILSGKGQKNSTPVT